MKNWIVNFCDNSEFLCRFTSKKQHVPIFTSEFANYINELLEWTDLLSTPILNEFDENTLYSITFEVPKEGYLNFRKHYKDNYDLFRMYIFSCDFGGNYTRPDLRYRNKVLRCPWLYSRFKKDGRYFVHIEADRVLFMF